MNKQKATEFIERLKKEHKKKDTTFISADQANFKEVIPGASMAVVWGNDQTGPHGSITKFEPGFDAESYMNPNDRLIVVTTGPYLHMEEQSAKRVGTSDFLFVPGATKYWR